MKNTAATLKTFFSGFELPAYTLGSVPEQVELPYITYPATEPEWRSQGNLYCQIWYPKNHLSELLTKADEVMAAIGDGIRLDMPGGYLVLYLASQQAQLLNDDWTQSAYISLLINSYHKPGE